MAKQVRKPTKRVLNLGLFKDIGLGFLNLKTRVPIFWCYFFNRKHGNFTIFTKFDDFSKLFSMKNCQNCTFKSAKIKSRKKSQQLLSHRIPRFLRSKPPSSKPNPGLKTVFCPARACSKHRRFILHCQYYLLPNILKL